MASSTLNSLWADYIRAKYIRNCPLVKVQFKNMKGFERRSWITARNLIIQHKRVIIGDGSWTNFWYDRWLGNYTLADFVPADHITNPELSVRDCISQQNIEDTLMHSRIFPDDICIALRHINLFQEHDKAVWSLSSSGNYSVSSTYKTINSNHRL